MQLGRSTGVLEAASHLNALSCRLSFIKEVQRGRGDTWEVGPGTQEEEINSSDQARS